MAKQKKKKKKGGSAFQLLALLAALAGIAAYNYQRNVAAQTGMERSFQGYSDEDLAALEAAYRSEVEALDARYARDSSRRVTVRDETVGEAQAAEFDRVHRAGRNLRSLGRTLSKQEATLEQLRQERAHRAGGAMADWQELLRKMFTYS